MKIKIKIFLIVLSILFIVAGVFGYYFYTKIYKSNVEIDGKEDVFLYIPTNAGYEQVIDSLFSMNIIVDKISLEWIMKKKNYNNKVRSGRFKITNHLSNNDLVNLLRSGKQSPVNVTFNNIRLKEELVGKISQQIELDSITILEALNDNDFLEPYGFNSENILILFIPNTYEFFWNTSLKQFFDRMHKEYTAFWNETRLSKLERTGLNKQEVSILASVVQAEQGKYAEEQDIIAGLYINRLKRGIPLQSDPTLIYAHGDFSIKRVYDWHKEINSPYNTYKFAGLPPGTINLPEIRTIDAVLNFDDNDYIYMCAKDDFSGFHNFSKTLSQHMMYARRYQNAVNKKGIK